MQSDIKMKIQAMILVDLMKLLDKHGHTKENVWRYRDAFFLGGNYDYLFEEFIKQSKLV